MKPGSLKAGQVGRRLRGTLDFASIDDHARLPWRFLARRMAVDALSIGR
jgi:hypothetical protein